MKIKYKIKVYAHDEITVELPYKHGRVLWKLEWDSGDFDTTTNYQWVIAKADRRYQLKIVTKEHLQFLNGKNCKEKIKLTVAASHQYKTLARIKMAFAA
jgi:hypothetical protein